jgi:hypothetical protein
LGGGIIPDSHASVMACARFLFISIADHSMPTGETMSRSRESFIVKITLVASLALSAPAIARAQYPTTDPDIEDYAAFASTLTSMTTAASTAMVKAY